MLKFLYLICGARASICNFQLEMQREILKVDLIKAQTGLKVVSMHFLIFMVGFCI